MRKLVVWALLPAGFQEPAISDISADKVKVYAEGGDETKVKAETERGCALYKRVPVALSVRRVGDFGREYLFACKDPS